MVIDRMYSEGHLAILVWAQEWACPQRVIYILEQLNRARLQSETIQNCMRKPTARRLPPETNSQNMTRDCCQHLRQAIATDRLVRAGLQEEFGFCLVLAVDASPVTRHSDFEDRMRCALRSARHRIWEIISAA